jgi:sugar O-acyltransferase (sialic acid O-acetyltransferase NeuD family)
MKKAIIGFGGFAKEVYYSMISSGEEVSTFFVNDEYYKNQENVLPLSKLNIDEYQLVVAIGDPILRKRIIDSLPKETKYFTHIHKSVIKLSDDVIIGEGSIVCSGTILTNNIKLGKHTHLNLMSAVGHDTITGDFFTTAPGAKVSGNCVIGNCVYLGTNASIREKITICDNVTIGLNSGVVKNIELSGVYGGLPSKKIK